MVTDPLDNLMDAIAYSRSVYGVFGPQDAPKLGPNPKPKYADWTCGCDCGCCEENPTW